MKEKIKQISLQVILTIGLILLFGSYQQRVIIKKILTVNDDDNMGEFTVSTSSKIINYPVNYTVSPTISNKVIITKYDVTNLVVSFQNSIVTNGVNLSFTNTLTNTFSQIVNSSSYNVFGRLFVVNTNNLPFDQVAKLALYTGSGRTGEDMRFLGTNRVFAVYNTNSINSSVDFIYVSDASGFSEEQLVFVSGATNELLRISSISGTRLNLVSPTIYSHAISNVVSSVMEYITPMYDATLANTLWGRLTFSSAQTVSMSNTIVITR